MIKGTVKFYNEKKGYGFITDDTGSDLFFHQTDVKNNMILEKGDEVTLSTEQGKRGVKACDVEVING